MKESFFQLTFLEGMSSLSFPRDTKKNHAFMMLVLSIKKLLKKAKEGALHPLHKAMNVKANYQPNGIRAKLSQRYSIVSKKSKKKGKIGRHLVSAKLI